MEGCVEGVLINADDTIDVFFSSNVRFLSQWVWVGRDIYLLAFFQCCATFILHLLSVLGFRYFILMFVLSLGLGWGGLGIPFLGYYLFFFWLSYLMYAHIYTYRMLRYILY